MKEELFTFLCFCNYLVFFDKLKHGKKRPTMDPDTEQLDNKASFLVTNDTFGKEYPETPVANDDNRLEGKGDEMKPGEQQLGPEATFILMQHDGEEEVEYDQDLADDSQLAEIPAIAIVIGEVADEHEEVDDEEDAEVALFGLVAVLHQADMKKR